MRRDDGAARADPHYFAKPDKALFQDIRRYFPITVQAQVAWAVNQGVDAAVGFVEDQIEAGAFDGGVARCRATTRKGKPCQRTPLPSATTARRTSTSSAAKSPRSRDPKRGRSAWLASRRRFDGALSVGSPGVSHDTDKLIRQLSLVAFLMAERRPLTARDIKSNVEGYQEMSDEAFARRFYSDRAELVALGVPLDSQRDEFTGEELYTLRSERYFLPELELDDEELAALQTCFYLLEGRFAYAEPLRLALQNLALGRSAGALAARADRHGGAGRGARPRLLARAAGPARQARGRDLEAAHGQVPLLVDLPRRGRGAHAQPVRAAPGERLVVRDRPRPRPRRHPHLPRLAHPLRHPLRDAPRARLPAAARVRHRGSTAAGPSGSSATSSARPASRSRPTPPGGSSAPTAAMPEPGRGRRLRHRVRLARASSRAGSCARTGARSRSSRRSCAGSSSRAPARRARPTRARRRRPPPRPSSPRARSSADRPAGPVAPERFGVLQSLLAYLLTACGEEREGVIPAQRARRAVLDPGRAARGAPLAAQPRQLRRRLLRGLRRAAGRRGARRQGALRRHVPPAAAADAARGARDPARARVRRPDDRGRRALAARPRPREARGDVRRVRADADARRRTSATRRTSSTSSRRRSTSTGSSRSST